MHREQHKCKLRQPPEMMPVPSTGPDYSTFSSNLRSAGLNLLPQILITAITDACRKVKKNSRASRRNHETIH